VGGRELEMHAFRDLRAETHTPTRQVHDEDDTTVVRHGGILRSCSPPSRNLQPRKRRPKVPGSAGVSPAAIPD
jgi:hypothetical protein